MALQWQPEEQPLKQLVSFLKDSLSGYDRAAQRHADQVSSVQPTISYLDLPTDYGFLDAVSSELLP
jgi:hypothetical protein